MIHCLIRLHLRNTSLKVKSLWTSTQKEHSIKSDHKVLSDWLYGSFTCEADPPTYHHQSLEPWWPLRSPLLFSVPLLTTLQTLWAFFSFKTLQAICCSFSLESLLPPSSHVPLLIIQMSAPMSSLRLLLRAPCPTPPSFCHTMLFYLLHATCNHLNAPHVSLYLFNSCLF